MRRIVSLVLCGLLLQSLVDSDAHASGFREWLRGLLGLKDGGFDDGARAPSCPREAGDLRRVRCVDGALSEQVIYRCSDCRWPVALRDNRVAVLRPDGIWLLTELGPSPKGTRAIKVGGGEALLGLTASTNTLLLLRKPANGDPAVLWLADLERKSMTKSKQQPSEVELREILSNLSAWRSQRQHAELVVDAIATGDGSACDGRVLAFRRVGLAKPKGPSGFCAAEEWTPGSDRFHPAWLHDGSGILFVARAPSNQ